LPAAAVSAAAGPGSNLHRRARQSGAHRRACRRSDHGRPAIWCALACGPI